MARAKSRPSRAVVASTVRRLLRERGPDKTICPSDVARALAPEDFRPLMPLVRDVAKGLVDRGQIVVLQKGEPVDIGAARGPIRLAAAPAAKTTYADAYRGIDFRARPELYRVGRGEEGVLIAEPYKSELLPLWKFRTPELAATSAQALLRAFAEYRRARDFVGMDMARKYLQMGYTRARRYANHRSGKKYAPRDPVRKTQRADSSERTTLPLDVDAEKAAAASIFHDAWQRAERDRTYAAWRRRQRATPPRRTAR